MRLLISLLGVITMRIAGCLLMMGMVFAYPDITANAARTALRVFGLDIVPTLFPYMVLTRTLMTMMKGMNGSSIWMLALLGWLGGSPSGASMIRTFSATHAMHRRSTLALCTLTGTISPVFLLRTVHAWFGDSHLLTLVAASHFAGAALSSLVVYLCCFHVQSAVAFSRMPTSDHEDNVISSCALSILGIGGCLVFYSVLSDVLSAVLFKSNGVSASFLHASLEIAGGLRALSDYGPQTRAESGILCAFCCGFSGLSMISQNAMFFKPLRITTPQLIGMGILRACLSAGVMSLLLSAYSSI